MKAFPKSRTIHIDGVGEVLLDRSPRARRINISLRPFKGIRVAVPRHVTFKQAEVFARSQRTWLKAHLPRMRAREEASRAFHTAHPMDPSQARRSIVARLDELARIHEFAYNRVFVRRQKTRWGSCSARKNINLNLNIVHLPVDLMDYVILHELVHTRVANHGPGFWQVLQNCLPQARQLDRRLRDYSLLLV